MHMLLEGVIPHTLKAMLQSFICVKRYFTIDTVNAKVLSFSFSRSESKSKPCPLLSKILNGKGSIDQIVKLIMYVCKAYECYYVSIVVSGLGTRAYTHINIVIRT